MLDVVIGITFTFLLLSLICSALSEIIERFLKKRASDLEKGIRELLQDTTPRKRGIVADLYNHSLIKGLYRGPYIPFGKKMPSYIPASNFALALLDNIMPAGTTNLSGAAGGGPPSTPGSSREAPTSTLVKSLTPLRNAIIKNLTASDLQKALISLVDAAGDDIDKARANIENWYNATMDRVAGWYKRRTQAILLCLGFALSIIMNADTIAIYKSLFNDPPLRNSLVAAAEQYALSKDTNQTAAPEARIDANAKKLYDLRLPIGWDWSNASSAVNNKELAIPASSFGWLLKILGWLITALAVSLGSSFWFDTLNKIMVIRSTVKPHEKSSEESSEDRQKK